MGAIENGLDTKTYEDKGKIIIDGYEIKILEKGFLEI